MRDTKTKLWIDLCNMIYTFRVTFICELKQQSKILKLYFFFLVFFSSLNISHFRAIIIMSFTSHSPLPFVWAIYHMGFPLKFHFHPQNHLHFLLVTCVLLRYYLIDCPAWQNFVVLIYCFFFLLETFFLFCYTPLSTKNYPFNFSRSKLT